MQSPKRRRSYRTRECDTCGRVETVRSDNASTTCRGCAVRIAGKKGLETIRRRRPQATCSHCGQVFCRSRSSLAGVKHPFCSLACKHAFSRVERTCKQCGHQFLVGRGRLSGQTNSTANFCSRPCYEEWLCQTERVNGRGSRWNAIRKEVLKEQPFCAVCGLPDKKKLQVHHIVPFRLTRSNDKKNLIPLCASCHKRVETWLKEFERWVSDPKQIMLMFAFNLRDQQMATYQKLKQLHGELR